MSFRKDEWKMMLRFLAWTTFTVPDNSLFSEERKKHEKKSFQGNM